MKKYYPTIAKDTTLDLLKIVSEEALVSMFYLVDHSEKRLTESALKKIWSAAIAIQRSLQISITFSVSICFMYQLLNHTSFRDCLVSMSLLSIAFSLIMSLPCAIYYQWKIVHLSKRIGKFPASTFIDAHKEFLRHHINKLRKNVRTTDGATKLFKFGIQLAELPKDKLQGTYSDIVTRYWELVGKVIDESPSIPFDIKKLRDLRRTWTYRGIVTQPYLNSPNQNPALA